MEIGRVIGSVWATKKDERLNGQKFVVVKMLDRVNEYRTGLTVSSDIVGAGVGDLVLVVRGGNARYAINSPDIPVDSAIVGIIDSIEVDEDV